jgi:hypothetical protein
MTQLGAQSRRGSEGRKALSALLVAAVAVTVGIASCSEPTDNSFTSATGGPGPGSGGSGGAGSSGTNTGGNLFDAGSDPLVVVTPASPVLKVEVPLTGQTVQFNCLNLATQEPVDGATWALSVPDYGTISASGVFTPNGLRVGDVNVTCHAGEASASTKLTIFIHATDNAGGLTQLQIDTLRGPPGGSDIGWQFMYPYDRTVFPRGILAPEIHLTQGTQPSNAYYVHIVSGDYEYEGFFSTAGTNTQLQMSQTAWEALTNSADGNGVEVHVSKLYNGQKVGPIYRTWILAPGNLHGTVYYNTYDSPLAGNGAMMRIKGNSPTPEVLIGNCTVCHSVSADGSTAAAANHAGPGGTFDLSNGMVNPPIIWQEAERAAFAGLFPKNGSVLVTHAQSPWVYTPGSGGDYMSDLRTKNGTIIPNSGIETFYAMTPVFSPDGTKLAFLDSTQNGTTLSILNYDEVTQKFTGYDVLSMPDVARYHSWPAFTPDSKYVIFQDGNSQDLATWSGNAKIFVVNTQSKQIVYPLNLNGDGYMPAGARDENLNFEPTIAPIASGGYFWVMFTSRRTYGNKLTGDQGVTKRLWVAAFDANAVDGQDPTHPAFYIGGQELNSGNSRGFWALDPCKADGQGCDTGDECCNGFCDPSMNDPSVFVCGPPSGECSDEFESCVTAADCCDPELECIGGKCSQIPPN